MAESHVISALKAKRGEIAGQVLKYQEELNRLCRELVHLDATIKLFDPEFDLSTIRPKRAYERDPAFNHGEISRLTLEAFRELGGKATTRQIVDAIHKAKGIDQPTTKETGDLQKRVNSYVKRNPDMFAKAGMDSSGSAVWGMAV